MKFDKKSLLLYAVTDRTWLNGRSLYEDVEKAIQGGATLIQLREKNLDYENFKIEALKIQELCRKYQIPFIINDNVELAKEINADGVHVGQNDMNAKNVREILGNEKILGVSAQTPEEAISAENNGADYIGAGAVFHTGTKLDAVEVTHETLKKICNSIKIPVVAIGGINAKNILQLENSGIYGVAVVSAIFASENIKSATQELRKLSEKITKKYHENVN